MHPDGRRCLMRTSETSGSASLPEAVPVQSAFYSAPRIWSAVWDLRGVQQAPLLKRRHFTRAQRSFHPRVCPPSQRDVHNPQLHRADHSRPALTMHALACGPRRPHTLSSSTNQKALKGNRIETLSDLWTPPIKGRSLARSQQWV